MSTAGDGWINPGWATKVFAGHAITFTLTPTYGYEIASVGGTCGGTLSGNNYTTAAVNANCTVVANFALLTHAITADVSPSGGTLSCSPNPVTHGSTSTCTATAKDGHVFKEWSGACSSVTGTTCSLTGVWGPQTVTAHFLVKQTIDFPVPAAPTFAPGGTFNVTASASSQLPVKLAAGPDSACTIVGTTVTMHSANICTITADQEGNDSYAPATQVTQSVTIGKAAQTLTFPAQTPASHTYAKDGKFTINPLAASAEPNSGKPITYSSLTTDVCEVEGSEVSMVKPGTCTLAADQEGNDDYAKAEQVKQSVALNAQKSFSGTTVPAEGGTPGPATASFTGGGDACRFETAAFIAPPEPPAGKTLPQGLFQFKLVGCDTTPVAMSIEWPEAVTGYTKYGKESAEATAASFFEPNDLVKNGNTVTFTLQDGQKGDDDWEMNGDIVDPSGPVGDAEVPPPAQITPVPVLNHWGLTLLGLLAAGLGARRLQLKG